VETEDILNLTYKIICLVRKEKWLRCIFTSPWRDENVFPSPARKINK
jgi:hypothetical protein